MELDRLKQYIQTQLGQLVPSIAKYKYALIILLVGIYCYTQEVGRGINQSRSEPQLEGTEQAFALESFENRLEKELSQIAGIGRVN